MYKTVIIFGVRVVQQQKQQQKQQQQQNLGCQLAGPGAQAGRGGGTGEDRSASSDERAYCSGGRHHRPLRSR